MDISRLISLVAPAESASAETQGSLSSEPAFQKLLQFFRGALPQGPDGQVESSADARLSTSTTRLTLPQPETEEAETNTQALPLADHTWRSADGTPSPPAVQNPLPGVPAPGSSFAAPEDEQGADAFLPDESSDPAPFSAEYASSSTRTPEPSAPIITPRTTAPSVERALSPDPESSRSTPPPATTAATRPTDQASEAPAEQSAHQADSIDGLHRGDVSPALADPEAQFLPRSEDDVEGLFQLSVSRPRPADKAQSPAIALSRTPGMERTNAVTDSANPASAPASLDSHSSVELASDLATRAQVERLLDPELTEPSAQKSASGLTQVVEGLPHLAPDKVEASGTRRATPPPPLAPSARAHISATAREVLSRVFGIALGGTDGDASPPEVAPGVTHTGDGSKTPMHRQAFPASARSATTPEQQIPIELEHAPAKTSAPLRDVQDGLPPEAGLQRTAPDAAEQGVLGAEIGRARVADAPHPGAPVPNPRRTDAWLDALLRRPAQFSMDRDGTSVLRLTIDEQSGVMTLRSRHDGDRMVISVAFSDASLHSAAQDDAAGIRNALQQLFDAAVDLSFTNHERQGDRQASGAPNQAGIGRREDTPRGVAEPDDEPRSRPRGVIGARHEWIG